jgi:hypothetical protein
MDGVVGLGSSLDEGAVGWGSVGMLVGMLVRASKTCVASKSGVGEAAGAGRLHEEMAINRTSERQSVRKVFMV